MLLQRFAAQGQAVPSLSPGDGWVGGKEKSAWQPWSPPRGGMRWGRSRSEQVRAKRETPVEELKERLMQVVAQGVVGTEPLSALQLGLLVRSWRNP